MNRVVLDADVLAPGFANPTATRGRLIELWQGGAYELVLSLHLLGEVARTFGDRYFRARLSAEDVGRAVRLLGVGATFTQSTVPVVGVATQPKDDLVVSTAASAGAHYLGTQDAQLLKLGSFQETRIVHPAELLSLLEAERGK